MQTFLGTHYLKMFQQINTDFFFKNSSLKLKNNEI